MWCSTVIAVVLVLHCVHSKIPFSPKYDNSWKLFKAKFQKNYGTKEEFARRLIFEQNVETIMLHNLEAGLGVYTYTLGINEFVDMTPNEIRKKRRCLNHINHPQNVTKTFYPPTDFTLPISVDWRSKGYVTPIKDQGDCGSCWAFSTTGSLEGQLKAKTGKLVSLSEQNLVDCSTPEGNEGCNGGLMQNSFKYVKKNGGIDTEESYPYKGVDSDCMFNKSTIGATCRGYSIIPRGNETALQAATAIIGPISVAIDADSTKFQFYKGGIYNDHSCGSSVRDLDHAVLVVGYGSKKGRDYWIVKNSWGTNWGMQGYILMSRNNHNQCGIATLACYPFM